MTLGKSDMGLKLFWPFYEFMINTINGNKTYRIVVRKFSVYLTVQFNS